MKMPQMDSFRFNAATLGIENDSGTSDKTMIRIVAREH